MMEGWLRLMPSWEMQPTYDFLLLLILFIYFLYRLSSKARVAGELEDELIIRLQSLLGNKWSLIAARLPGRTDNEIENYGYILIRASSLNTGSVRQQNSDASNNSISSTSSFSQREIWDPPIGDGGSTYVHVSSNRVTEDEDDDHDGNRDLTAAKEDDDSISEITDFSIWEKGEIIGTGACGTVYVAHNRETRALCAVKELRDVHKPGNGESIKKEIKILSQLEHTNVVKYYGHEIVGCHISLYMEYIQPGSLKKYIWKQRVLPELLIRNFTGQILSGLVYLHSKRVVHRDIKPDNLLVDSNNIIKLVDFGLSKHLEESVGRHSMLGTPYYTAPEVVDKKIEYKSSHEAYAADIWSLGCVIIEMFSGKHPWPGFEPVQVIYKAGKKQHPPIPEKLCPEGNDFLKLCFTRTPADRPSASALLNHPFVKPQITSHTGRRK